MCTTGGSVHDLRVLGVCMVILLLNVAAGTYTPLIVQAEGKPVVVVTFYSLKEDVERLMCGVGLVYSLVPAGIDPHEYQLSTRDVEVLSEADVIVSTGHTHFELEIRELVEKGEVRAKLVDIVENATVVFYVNPVTGRVNYHMPIRDPYNYVVFVFRLARVLAEVDPERAWCYHEKALIVISDVLNMVSTIAGRFSGFIVVDKPHVQYAVTWLGFNVVSILRYEEEAPIQPEHADKTIQLLRDKVAVAVFITEPSDAPESEILLEEAERHGIPVFKTPSPVTTGPYRALKEITRQIAEFKSRTMGESTLQLGRQYSEERVLMLTLGISVGLVAGFALSYALTKRRGNGFLRVLVRGVDIPRGESRLGSFK